MMEETEETKPEMKIGSPLNHFNIFHSEEMNELFGAMASAQGEMGKAISNETNPFFKAKYPTLDVVIDVYREPLAKHGLSFMQWSVSNGQMMNMLAHKSGQYIASIDELRIKESTNPQAHGSAYSYLRRYSAMGVMGLGKASEDDDGNQGSGKGSKPSTDQGGSRGSGGRSRKPKDEFQSQLNSQGTYQFETSPDDKPSDQKPKKDPEPTPEQLEIIRVANNKLDEATALSHLSNIWSKHGSHWRTQLPGKLILPVQDFKDQKREALKKARDEKEQQRISEREKENEKAEV
jgi:hypothetical protein